MNKIILMGRLTRDPEVRYGGADNQTAIGRFSLAVDRRFRRAGDSVEADFFNCTCFGKQGEFVEKYLHKGTKVVLSGRIQNDNYTNKEGQQVYGVRIMVDEIEFAESKNAAGNGDNGYNNNGGNYGNNNYGGGRSQAAPSGAGDGFMNIPDGIDEELPFN